jgi:hypothetical protein
MMGAPLPPPGVAVSQHPQTWTGVCLQTLSKLSTQNEKVEVEVNLRPTVSRSVCLGVGLQIFVFSLTIVGFLMWGILSDLFIH